MLLAQDCWDKKVRAEKLEHDSKNGTVRSEQAEQDSQERTSWIGLPGLDFQNRPASSELLG